MLFNGMKSRRVDNIVWDTEERKDEKIENTVIPVTPFLSSFSHWSRKNGLEENCIQNFVPDESRIQVAEIKIFESIEGMH